MLKLCSHMKTQGNIQDTGCTLEEFPIISEAVPGGDGWLGQCFEKSKVRLVHDWRFKSLPPIAFPSDILPHITSFHKVNCQTVMLICFNFLTQSHIP